MGRRKKKTQEPPPPLGGLPLPPPPGGAALPPPPPPVEDVEDAPETLRAPSLPEMPGAENSSGDDDSSSEYSKIWERRSKKPLQQVYGHIDRLGDAETGSLLDRYADRFGHELDREIIVLRGKDHSDAEKVIRDAPTVELIGESDEEFEELEEDQEIEEELQDEVADESIEEETVAEITNNLTEEEESELQSQLDTLEDEIRRLKPKYQMAKSKGQTGKLKKLKPALKALIDERKLIMSVLSGEESIEAIATEPADEADDQFVQLVSIVDDLLGKMPEDAIDEFLASDDFEIYKEVASAPADADKSQRANFFEIVDSKLGQMPEDAINEFISSDDFTIYQSVGSELRS